MAKGRKRRGVLIVLDGPDGCGKSTQAVRLVSDLVMAANDVVHLREPGGTSLGESIRQILLDPRGAARSIRAEIFLYLAARAQVVEERIRPAIDAGQVVVCERFSSSTIVYQGSAAGEDLAAIRRMDRFATGGLRPDVTLILDVQPETGLRRLGRVRGLDRIERRSLAYHRKVRAGFLAWARRQGRRAIVVDANRGEDAVATRIREEVARALR